MIILNEEGQIKMDILARLELMVQIVLMITLGYSKIWILCNYVFF